MNRIWSKDWTKLGSNRYGPVGHDYVTYLKNMGKNAIAYRMKIGLLKVIVRQPIESPARFLFDLVFSGSSIGVIIHKSWRHTIWYGLYMRFCWSWIIVKKTRKLTWAYGPATLMFLIVHKKIPKTRVTHIKRKTKQNKTCVRFCDCTICKHSKIVKYWPLLLSILFFL